MTNKHCPEFAEWLVEFADGESTAERAARVAEHLDGCAACRAAVDRLQRSLAAARAEWQQAAAEDSPDFRPTKRGLSPAPCFRSRFRSRRVWRLAACAAAAALLMALASVPWWLPRTGQEGPPPGTLARNAPPESPPTHAETTAPAAAMAAIDPASLQTEAEIEEYINRQSRIARLSVSAKYLAAVPGLEKEAAAAREYIARVARGED